MPTIIKMNDQRRGNLGGGRYRTFEEGETYTVTETAGAPDTVTPFLAQQFVDAGEADEVDADEAPTKARTEAVSDTPSLTERVVVEDAVDGHPEVKITDVVDAAEAATEDPNADLAEMTVEDLRAEASHLEIAGRSKLTTSDALTEAIVTARAATE